MIHKIQKIVSFFLLILFASSISAQSTYRSPLDFKLLLSGNFGELRGTHFHAGIDIKTQGVINKPVYAIADGYVSRIAISRGGYGNALYITHPSTGQTSVYGHLNKFVPEIDRYVKDQQYKKESFIVNLFPPRTLFRVKKGQLVAYSGNRGSSGGPHLHFELRDTKTEKVIDPLPYFATQIKDVMAPELCGIAIYPKMDKGVVNGSGDVLRMQIKRKKNGSYTLIPLVRAWGEISIGVKAFDRMNASANLLGVKYIRLYENNKQIFSSRVNTFSFDDMPMIGGYMDFAAYRKQKSYYVKSFVEPGDSLAFCKSVNGGYIKIEKEKIYHFRYELEDCFGNTTRYLFNIVGQKQGISSSEKSNLAAWNEVSSFEAKDHSCFLSLNKACLFDDSSLKLIVQEGDPNKYLSGICWIKTRPVALKRNAQLSLKIDRDALADKSQYGMVSINGTQETWIGGKYTQGRLVVGIKELGLKYAVSADTVPPQIVPIEPETWIAKKQIVLKLTDDKSGISWKRGSINGKFVLFTEDVKSNLYIYKFDEQLDTNKNKELVFRVLDNCGNVSEYRYSFVY